MTDGILDQEFAAEEQAPVSPAAVAMRTRSARLGAADRVIQRPVALGKFLFAGGEKLYVRGVTYGPFAPQPDGCEYGTHTRVAEDFARMHASGLNAVRVYTPPPRWFLDAAHEHGLRVMVGLPWEQHITFLDERKTRLDIIRRIRDAAASAARHPALLCYAIGNEIPAPIVRWYGACRVERWLEQLYDVTKQVDSDALVTYVNYPSTEYLDLSFADLVAFNVYLETPDTLTKYLARLQNIAGDRPLLMAEVGLDARRNGAAKQAETLAWQVRTAMSSGCAGSFVFSWTDEWHRSGRDILDWNFGLTQRDRTPRPALAAVSKAFDAEPVAAPESNWPKVSVVVCSYNGSRTLEECLRGVSRLDYPDYEVIVVDDGSTDATAEIARRFPVKLIQTSNEGLSHARNVGLRAATGEIVAYLDDDAYPDPHWLHYLAHTFTTTDHAGVGGPNIPPSSDGPVAHCVGCSPGGPTHVLISDTEAEHIPGCNMAFRRERLLAVGGFDPQFRMAGDDVDVCWRLRDRGWTLGFSPAAVVWHHRRASVRTYLKQQFNYGRAEAMLERKWPQKYNAAGHLIWTGRLYGSNGYLESACPRASRRRIYHGTWGTALFQSVYHPGTSLWRSLPVMPEWYALTMLLWTCAFASVAWAPLRWTALPAGAMTLATVVAAVLAGRRARLKLSPRSYWSRAACRALVVVLHVAQPAVRQLGRMRDGLTPWRLRGARGFVLPRVRSCSHWSTSWRGGEQRLAEIESNLRTMNAVVLRGGDYDRWDLELRGGMLGGARLQMTIEEHGGGNQLVRLRCTPRFRRTAMIVTAVVAITALAAGFYWHRFTVPVVALGAAALVVGVAVRESGAAVATLLHAVRAEER